METTTLPNQDVLVAIILMGLIGLVGIVGNTIMLRTLIKYKNLRKDIYVIMGGLAIADILHLVIAVPAHIINFLGAADVITDPWCKASQYISNATAYIAAYHLVILAVLRGILLTNRDHPSPTKKHAFICSCVVWVIAPLATVPVIQSYHKDEVGICYWTPDTNDEKEIWMSAAFSCFIPIGLIIFIYMTTHYIGQRYFSDSYSRQELQMARVVSAVITSFVVCQMPYQVLNLHVYYREEVSMQEYPEGLMKTLYVVLDYFLCLLLVDKAIRPVLYSKLSSDLGERFDEVINCTYCSRYYTTEQKVEAIGSTSSEQPLTNSEDLTEDNV